MTKAIFVVMGAAVALLTFQSPAFASADDAAKVERGKQVYTAQRCQVCHSIEGRGNRRSPLDGVGSRLTERDIRRWIVAPKEMNPNVKKNAYDGLPQDQLDALVAYLLSLKATTPGGAPGT